METSDMARDGEEIGPTPVDCADEVQRSQPSDCNFSGCEDFRQPEAGHADEVHLKDSQDFHSSGCEGPSCEDPRQSDNSDTTYHNNRSSDQPPANPCSPDNDTIPEKDKDIPRRRVSIADVPPFVHYYEEKTAESDEQQSESKTLSLASVLSRIGPEVSLFTRVGLQHIHQGHLSFAR